MMSRIILSKVIFLYSNILHHVNLMTNFKLKRKQKFPATNTKNHVKWSKTMDVEISIFHESFSVFSYTDLRSEENISFKNHYVYVKSKKFTHYLCFLFDANFRSSCISKTYGAISDKKSNCSLNNIRVRIIIIKDMKAFRIGLKIKKNN